MWPAAVMWPAVILYHRCSHISATCGARPQVKPETEVSLRSELRLLFKSFLSYTLWLFVCVCSQQLARANLFPGSEVRNRNWPQFVKLSVINLLNWSQSHSCPVFLRSAKLQAGRIEFNIDRPWTQLVQHIKQVLTRKGLVINSADFLLINHVVRPVVILVFFTLQSRLRCFSATLPLRLCVLHRTSFKVQQYFNMFTLTGRKRRSESPDWDTVTICRFLW